MREREGVCVVGVCVMCERRECVCVGGCGCVGVCVCACVCVRDEKSVCV